jgi:hypothetical protein
MANVAQIKRSATTNHASTTIPTTSGAQLDHGELGWVDGSRQLFIGRNTANPESIVVEEIIGRAATLSNATTPKRGVACFNSDDFALSAHNLGADTGGVVSLVSIANTHLTNSTVSYGGVVVALGAADATPAFNLSDATAYPTSSLTGTITNAQLAGSVANAKLVNPKWVISDGSNVSDIALGGTCTIQGTANEVTATESAGTVTLSLPSTVNLSALTVSGDLTVGGATTTTLAQTLEIEDKFIMLAKGNTTRATAAASPAAGLFVQCTTSGQADPSLYWTASGWKTDEAFISGGVVTATGGNSGNWNTAYTDRLKWDGGATGLTAATGRTSLGLVIGTDVQAYDATYLVGSDIGGTVQAYDTDLAAIAGLSNANGNFIVGSVSGWIVESGSTARTSLGLGTSAVLNTAAVANGAATVATGDQIYDYIASLNHITASSTDTLTNKTLASDSVTWS